MGLAGWAGKGVGVAGWPGATGREPAVGKGWKKKLWPVGVGAAGRAGVGVTGLAGCWGGLWTAGLVGVGWGLAGVGWALMGVGVGLGAAAGVGLGTGTEAGSGKFRGSNLMAPPGAGEAGVCLRVPWEGLKAVKAGL